MLQNMYPSHSTQLVQSDISELHVSKDVPKIDWHTPINHIIVEVLFSECIVHTPLSDHVNQLLYNRLIFVQKLSSVCTIHTLNKICTIVVYRVGALFSFQIIPLSLRVYLSWHWTTFEDNWLHDSWHRSRSDCVSNRSEMLRLLSWISSRRNFEGKPCG